MTLKQVFLVLVFLTTLYSCVQETNFPVDKVLICDTELLTAKGGEFIAANDSSEFFTGGWNRSNLAAHSGKYSALTIPKTKAFAMGYKVFNVGPDAYFNISVWRKSKDGKGALVVAGENTGVLYLASSEPVEILEDGWGKLEIEFFTPPHFEDNILSIYVWNNGTDTVYYDDLTIEREAHKQYPAYNYDEGLNIIMDTTDYIKIMDKRKKAFQNGILQTTDKDWVKGLVVENDNAMKAKIRLKGDWLDHLWGDKWSYRVKMRKNNSINRLRTFSLQTPSARGFLLEWLTHQLYHENDILTTRYGFTPLMLNNKPCGIYAWEEHFVKQLPEWNQRREGPILKFSEDPFWQILKMSINSDTWPAYPFYQTATIIPFGQSRTTNSPVLYNQFLVAQKLMYQYKTQQKTPSEIFDIDKLAKYYAMLEITHARHGMTWHNQRMYYNPAICKLEPIAFDGYTDHTDPDISIKDNVAYRTIMENESVQLHDYLIFNLFTDTIFLNKYLNYLDKYSKPDFITNFMLGSKQEAFYYDSLLSMEFPNYHHNTNFFIESAEAIQSYLPELKKIIKTNLSNGEFVFDLRKDTFTDTTIFENTPEFFVNVYTENKIDDTLELNIHNYFPQDLTFVGTGQDKKVIINYFNDKFGIHAFTNDNINRQKMYSVDTSANYLFFMVDGKTDIYSVPIMPWPHPKGETPQQELWGKIYLNNELIDRITGKDIHIKKENITIDKPIIIPDGYKVHFYAGTKINLIDSAMIISYSPVNMIGTVKNPVVITSSDFTGNGFTVLQADGKSVLENVVFDNLNTLNYHNWTLTGSLTFYESNVSITNARFYNNQCEDALNIIRSEFVLNNSSFEYIYGDAFDGDFCTGEVNNTSFINIGNDALDFSGSDITIKNTEIIDAKDKGISGGEDSRVMVINTSIKNSNIGIASKDLSTVEVTNSKIETCNYGLVLLQKKPEFGPSTIIFKNSTILNSKVEMLIEKHSTVIVDGVEIKGKEKNVGEMFY